MISTRGRYAVRVLIDIAENDNGNYIPLKDIADRQGISKKYLEIIVKDLVAGGILSGKMQLFSKKAKKLKQKFWFLEKFLYLCIGLRK